MSCAPDIRPDRPLAPKRSPVAWQAPAKTGSKRDKRGKFKLRGYQRELAERVLEHLEAGDLDVGAEAPMGSGKTTICKAAAAALHASGKMRLVVVSAPLGTIVDAWERAQPAVWLAGTMAPWRARRATSEQLADPHWWATAEGAWVATRQAMTAAKAIAAVRKVRSLSGVLVIADEAHHHHERTKAGQHARVVRERGGAVLLVSGTPWHERGSVFTESTKTVRLSQARYARERCPAGLSWAPSRWVVERRHVGTAKDARLAVEPASGRDDEVGSARQAAEICAAIAADWLADERPRAIVNLPWTSWRAPMLAALRKVWPAVRVLDMVGDGDKADRKAKLEREAGRERYEDGEVDIVLSCARMNEGTDWPVCSAVYNVRIPGPAQLILQRWARASRRKWDIVGYPPRWQDVQLMRFYVPALSGDAADAAWDAHRDMALLLACYLEDYETALRWASTLGPERAPRFKGRRGDRGRQAAPAETDPVEDARIRSEAVRLAGRPAATMATVIAGLRRNHPGIAPARLKALALGAVEAEGVDLQAAARKAEASALRPGRATGWVRAEMVERWAAIADEFAHVMVSPRADLVRRVADFTAETAQAVAQRLRDEGAARGFAWQHGLILTEASIYRGRFGRWPTAFSGSWAGFAGATWGAANDWLRSCGSSLSSLLRPEKSRDQKMTPEQSTKAIARFIAIEAREPSQNSNDVKEQRLARRLNYLRRRDPQILTRHGIPTKGDRASAISRTARLRGRERNSEQVRTARGFRQYKTLGEQICPLARSFRSTQRVRIEGETGVGIQTRLRNAHKNPNWSRGLAQVEDLCQVSSIARANDEIAADCWRLWLDGADQPDPRPWAEILAAGDNARVVKAARVAFLDWANPGPDGKPARRPWEQAEWPDLRA